MLCQNPIKDREETTESVCLQFNFSFLIFFFILVFFFNYKLLEAFRFQSRTQARLPESATAIEYKIKDKEKPSEEFLKKVLRDFLSNVRHIPKLCLKVYILPSFHVYNLWIIWQKKGKLTL